MSSGDDIKAQAQQRFGQYAEEYVRSARHAKSADLEILLNMAQPQPGWLALDIATGGGHTALKFASHVRRVVSSDLTPAMLEAARAFIAEQGATTVVFSAADAENLPFANSTFDLVTCRIAPHHFPNCFRFVQECARTLKPGGWLLVQDQVVPDDERAARYIDSFERLRDPSHHRVYDEHEWRGMYLDAGLSVEHVEPYSKSAGLVSWAGMQGCAPEIVERLEIMLAQAPQAVAEWLRPRCMGSPDATFDHRYILILGRK